jgi:NADH-quinone oxidoreductase subunit J
VTSGWLYATATALGTIGLWLLLPRYRMRGRWIGAVLGVVALGLFLSRIPPLGSLLDESLFVVLATVTVVSGAAAMTFHNPVYCAIWFALMLLGTAGLFLYQGAQFLGAATIVVYAGAILVTLLFVLMLANPRGRAYYDRTSWEAPLSAAAGIVLVGILTMTVGSALPGSAAAGNSLRTQVMRPDQQVDTDSHVAVLGSQLFTRHLVAVEVAGVVLLVALVGAAAIVLHSRGTSAVAEDLDARAPAVEDHAAPAVARTIRES